MQIFLLTNALTAFIGVIASMVIGFIWYGPIFGSKWGEIIGMKPASGMSDEEKKAFGKKMIPIYALNILTAFIMYFALAYFAVFIGRLNVSGAALYALFVWFGFVMPVLAGVALWSGKSKKLAWAMFGITAGYQLLTLVLAAVIWALMYPMFM